MNKLMLLVFIILCILLTACKPTPQLETIQQKDGKKLMEIIDTKNQEDISYEKYEAPQKWEEILSLLGNKVKVSIKADVVVPKATAYPTARIEPDKFTIEHFRAVEKLFFPNCLYCPLDAPQTKEELEQLILITKRSINDPNSDFNRPDLSEERRQLLLQEKQAAIKSYEKLYKTAPREEDLRPITVTEELLYDNTFDLNAKVLSKDRELKAYIFMNANNHEKKRINCIFVSNYLRDPNDMSHYVMMKPHKNSEFECLVPPPVTITQDDAIKTATEAIVALGIKGMDLNYCYKLRRGDSEAYEVYYTKTYRGIPSNYVKNGGEYNEYAFDYRPEVLHIRVNDDGIISFRWDSPSKEIELRSCKTAPNALNSTFFCCIFKRFSPFYGII